MSRREEIGSWIQGTSGPAGRGNRVGLPSDGRGALAPLGRRVLALIIDWALASLISYAFFDYAALATLAVFAASTALLVGTAGFTIGHRVLRLQVVRVVDVVRPPTTKGKKSAPEPPIAEIWRPPGLLLGAVRTVLLSLVVPAVVWDGDGRGLHDVAAGTAIVRR